MSFLICGSGTTTVLNNAIIDDIIQDKMGWPDKPPHKNSTDSSSSDQKEWCIAHQRFSFEKTMRRWWYGVFLVSVCGVYRGRSVPGVAASLKDGRSVDGHFGLDNDRLGISYVIFSWEGDVCFLASNYLYRQMERFFFAPWDRHSNAAINPSTGLARVEGCNSGFNSSPFLLYVKKKEKPKRI